MSRPIDEVARMSGISSRTLRHYDAIGLLTPSSTGPGGRRQYGEAELLRLQRILLLRDLGLRLDVIAEVLDRGDPVEALRRHRAWLAAEGERLGRLLGTVDATIRSLEGGDPMTPEQLFEGFEPNPYEAEARERWGDEAVDASKARVRNWTSDDAALARSGYTRVHEGLAPLLDDGVPAGDPRVQELIRLHFETTSRFWTPDAESYRGLARMYLDDERFRRNIGPDALVAYLAEAMEVFAATQLAPPGDR